VAIFKERKFNMTMLGKHQSEEARRKVANYRRGKHLTVEAKEKLSKFHKGKILSEETRKKMSIAKTGENNPNYGKSPSLKTRNKIRKTRLKEKHWNWKGGVTPDNKKIRVSVKYRIWREAVFMRDNWTCKDCGIRGSNLHPHHIKSFAKYPKLRFDINNGETLCIGCHKQKHLKKEGLLK